MKRFAYMIVCLILFIGFLSMASMLPVSVIEAKTDDNKSITLYFGNNGRRQMYSRDGMHAVNAFFEENELDYNYYIRWLEQQEAQNLQSVTFTLGENEDKDGGEPGQLSKASSIKKSRIVYVDRNYHYTGKKNQFPVGKYMSDVVSKAVTLKISKYSKVIESIASVVGIVNPQKYFGKNRVRKNKEYYINDGANRVVTKFVELYAPVSGKLKWYAWGFAEGDYVRHGVQLYYKGLEKGAKKNVYHQYYTQNYYNTTKLTSLVKAAYPNRTYQEAVNQTAARAGHYILYNRSISRSKYLEYDSLVK